MGDGARLGSLLGRWHQWRRAYSHERGYARAVLTASATDSEDDLERTTMNAIESAIDAMPDDLQLALQHIARAECMGVEVITNPRLGPAERRRALVEQALIELERRLQWEGVM